MIHRPSCNNHGKDLQPTDGIRTNRAEVLAYQQQLYAKVIFEAQFVALYDNAFQDYFQKLMQYRYPNR